MKVQAAIVDKSQMIWTAQIAGKDTCRPRTFQEAAKMVARKYGVDLVIDEVNHTVDFQTDDDGLIYKLALALSEIAGEYEVD